MKKRWIGLLLAVVLLCLTTWSGYAETDGTDQREGDSPAVQSAAALLAEYWTEGSEAAESLNAYLLAVTDEASPDYIPVEDRVAVFDLDGTLMCETYPFCFEYMVFADYALNSGSETITDEVRAVAQEIVDAAGGKKPDDMSTRQAAAAAIAYRGMTVAELSEVVRQFKNSDAWGFSGMTRGEAFYRPMVELVEVLQQNDFTVYIVTATERNIVREVIAGTLKIPASQVIGTEYGYTATGQGDAADTDYTFKPTDRIVFDGNYYGENAKTSKVDAIVREIGQQPVLAFGNSSGDLAMEIYTISGNPRKSAAYMVVADDGEREYGDAAGAEDKKKSYAEQGIGIISMRDDFKTIYGDGVSKVVSLPESAAACIPGWAEDSPAMASIVDFVRQVTDENSPDYVPPEMRIALFDSDGTLVGERYPTYSDQCMLVYRLLYDETAAEVNPEDAAFAKELEEAWLNHDPLPDSPRSTAQMAAESFKGFTVEEYQDYVREFMKQPVPGFEGMTYGTRLFVPMAELVRYLAENGFQVYICSGTERIFLRGMIADTLGKWIPPYRVIGSEFSLTATGQGETAGRNYTYAPEDQVLLEGNMTFKNLKMNKVVSIVNEIGVPPVLVFGNSSGDLAMAQYAMQNGGKAYMLLCDDTERDYGDLEEAAGFAEKCAALGIETISMKNEFQTIYAEEITMSDEQATEPEEEALAPAA